MKRKISRKDLLRIIRRENKMPGVLILAELFLLVMCISYMFKIAGLATDVAIGPDYPSVRVVLVLEMDIIFLILTILATLGISSRRAESWRKVVRSCITFAFATIMSTYILESDSYSHKFDFDPIITTVLLIILLSIMITSVKIKRFYTPPMTKVPKTTDWIIYALYGKLFNVEYHIRTKEDIVSESKGTDFGMPDDLGPLIDNMKDIGNQ